MEGSGKIGNSVDAKLFNCLDRFFSKQLCIWNLNFGGRKRSKLYQAVEKEGDIWIEKRERKERKEAKEEVYSI